MKLMEEHVNVAHFKLAVLKMELRRIRKKWKPNPENDWKRDEHAWYWVVLKNSAKNVCY